MFQSNIDSNDPLQEPDYFVIDPLSDDMHDLTSIEYLETYILNAESSLIRHVENNWYSRHNIDKENFDEVLNLIFLKKKHCSHRIESYDIIYNNAILEFKSHQNEELLLCGLRFLFASPTYFIETNSENREILISALIDLVLNQDEPVSTHAIKCLLIAAYIFRRSDLKIMSFKLLNDVLIERISSILQFDDKSILTPVLGLKFDTNEDKFCRFNEWLHLLVDNDFDQLKIDSFDVTFYLENCVHTNGHMQIFYHMALYKYIVYYFEAPVLVENILFWNLLYSCIDFSISRIDNLIYLALTIILELIENSDFLCQFLKTNGVDRLCCIPHCLASSSMASLILTKIIEKPEFKKNQTKNNLYLVIKYGLSFFGSSNKKKSCNIILNVFNTTENYEIFINQNGIELIFEKVKNNEAFIHMEEVGSHCSDIYYSYLKILEKIKKILKILLLHIFFQITSILPIKIKDYIKEIKFEKISDDSYDILLEYFENEIGLEREIKFFEELLEMQNFEVIVSISRMTCQYSMDPSKIEIYKDLMYFLKFMSIHPRSKALFIHSFDPNPQHFSKGNSLVVLFRSITEQYYYEKFRDYNFEFIPFQVYHNLLLSCFPDFKTCKKVLKLKYYFNINGHDNETFGLQHDEISILFMDDLIENSLIYHILKILPEMNLNFTIKIYAIKCLMMLLTRKNAIPIVSAMLGNFITKFTETLIMISNYVDSNSEIKLFLIYSISLIYKLSIYAYFKSINNVSFSPSTYEELNKAQKSKTLLQNTENWLIQSHRHHFQIFKDCIDSIMRNNIFKEKLKLCFELIHRIFPINLNSKDHFKHSKIYISYNYGINLQTSVFTKSEFRYTTHQNSLDLINKKFDKITHYFDKTTRKRIYDAKLLIDDRIIWTDKEGLYNNSSDPGIYTQSLKEICYIDDSYNGEFIIGCGVRFTSVPRFTNIWKYDSLLSNKKIMPKNIYYDIYYSKITNDNFNIFGIDHKFTTKFIDIETSEIVKKFCNQNITRFPSINCAAISNDNNLLLFNGDLFCTRSEKLIYSFPNFNQHLSGIFVHSDTRILKNCELWDLRNTKLLDRINELENFIIKKTYRDDILIAIQKYQDYRMSSLDYHLQKWKIHFGSYGKKLILYNINTFSSTSVIDFKNDIAFANISRDCTKITVGQREGDNYEPAKNFDLISIGDKSHVSILRHYLFQITYLGKLQLKNTQLTFFQQQI